MAWQPRRHWEWLVVEHELDPDEQDYSTLASCSICGTWLVQRVEGVPHSIRLNSDQNNPMSGTRVESTDPDTALLRWSYGGGSLSIRCRCGWPHTLVAAPTV